MCTFTGIFKEINLAALVFTPSGFFVPGFPKLMHFQEHHDRILKKMMPKLKQHLVRHTTPLWQLITKQVLHNASAGLNARNETFSTSEVVL